MSLHTPALQLSMRQSWPHYVAYDKLFRVSNNSQQTVYVAIWLSDGSHRGKPESIEPGGTRLYRVVPHEYAQAGYTHMLANFSTTPVEPVDESTVHGFIGRLYAKEGGYIEVTDWPTTTHA